MIHGEESVAAELDRVRQRPAFESAPPVLAAFTVDVFEGAPVAYALRVRHVLSAALQLACTAEFNDEDLPTAEFPDWFTTVSVRDGEVPPQEFARQGRTAFADRSGGGPWSLQNWIYRFDPEDDSRGWEFWDIVPVGPSRLSVWVDSWGGVLLRFPRAAVAAVRGRCHTRQWTGTSHGGRVGVRGARSVTEAEQEHIVLAAIGAYQVYPMSYEAVEQLAAGVALDQALDVTDPDSWIRIDLAVRELTWQRPELFHSNASPSGRRMNWGPNASRASITWPRTPSDAELALALCHPDGRIREAALDQAEERPALLALVVIRCADWAGPVRERARALLAETPPPWLATHAALILRVGRRSRGGFAQELLTGALRASPAAQAEALLDSGDRATARLAHRVALERRLLPAAWLARTAASHRRRRAGSVRRSGRGRPP
ncbi:hypothetical protein [Streptomyces sp. NPDC002763]|uniref:hypothetical protein n=1 Tax=Streptomyces sp. NPDC002763 TaxID=3154427 RepID=UPI0033197CCF